MPWGFANNYALRWPGPFGSGFLSPQPPGVVRIGPVRRGVNPHHWANESWSFFFWGIGGFSTAFRRNTHTAVILRSRALARCLEGSPRAPRPLPSFEARQARDALASRG